ncbi:excalibur calcium-binding domain-containing protein [Streptomyces sp. NPDC059534]|uniref:excalibur calcium-binding domain-containing protein n=1 Tax=Streptomyces sp. NPDC059534 TaxID=3346859 RepID=UPI0036B3C085
MYAPPHPYQPAPLPAPRRWWQHPALIISLLVILPPAGIVLTWTSRWSRTKKIVATVLSGLWFLLFALSDPPKDTGGTDPKPATSSTAPVSPTPTPTAGATTEPTPSATPTTESPTATPEPTAEPTTEAPTTKAPEPTPTKSRTPAARPSNRQPETAEPTATADESNVYYANCTAVRAAGAAPIRIGDPGYDSHLDRDGDGVACER